MTKDVAMASQRSITQGTKKKKEFNLWAHLWFEHKAGVHQRPCCERAISLQSTMDGQWGCPVLRTIACSGIYLYLAGKQRQKDCREFKVSLGYIALGQPRLQSQTLLQKSKESSIAVNPVPCTANLPGKADSLVHSECLLWGKPKAFWLNVKSCLQKDFPPDSVNLVKACCWQGLSRAESTAVILLNGYS